MSRERRANRRVGTLVLAALAVAATALFLLGDKQNLFRAKNRYTVRFADVNGLQRGASVQLNGVDVGQVEKIVLPEDMGQHELVVHLSIDARYEQRLREDSAARIRTLGLLGDKYLEVTSGSPAAPPLPEGGEIPAAAVTNVDALVSSGEDLMQNVLAISAQLTSILGRMERGEGLLGELTKDMEPGKNVTTEIYGTLAALREAAEAIGNGKGPVPRLLNDEDLGAKLEVSVGRLDTILEKAEGGEGVLPMLLTDTEARAKLDRTLSALEQAAAKLSQVADGLTGSDALLAKLLTDEEYGKKIAGELDRLLANLAVVSDKLAHGEGTAARLIDDPALFEALNDIVLGVNESKMLRWLVRNRQKKGIESRYDDAREAGEAPPAKELPDAP